MNKLIVFLALFLSGMKYNFFQVKKIPFDYMMFLLFGCRNSLKIMIFMAMAGCYKHKWKKNKSIGEENKRVITTSEVARSKYHTPYEWVHVRRVFLEKCIIDYNAQEFNQDFLSMINELNGIIANVKKDGTPVILAPLHMVSDLLAVFVASKASQCKTTVIISAGAHKLTQKDFSHRGVNLHYCSIHQSKYNFAEKMTILLDEVIAGDNNLIIFPDIIPSYSTHNADTLNGSRLTCRMFNRAASIHAGIIKLSKMTKAKVIPFYLSYGNSFSIHVYSPVCHLKIAEELPRILESAILNNSDDWLLWHYKKLYFC